MTMELFSENELDFHQKFAIQQYRADLQGKYDEDTDEWTYGKVPLEESKEIRKEFNWERVAEIGMETINEFLKNYVKPQTNNSIHISYIDGPRVEIKGTHGKKYFVEFIDGEGKVRFFRYNI